MKKYSTLFYQKENGEEPVKEFLIGLDNKMRLSLPKNIEQIILQEGGMYDNIR